MSRHKPKPTPADKAFANSTGNTLGDVELQPWTPTRIIAAQSMGMLYPRIPAEAMEQYRKTRIYPGALKDIIIVLWLCSLKDIAEVKRANRSPDEAYDRAEAWATTRGIHKIKTDAFWDAYVKFMEIVGQESDSITQPVGVVPSNEDDDEEGKV